MSPRLLSSAAHGMRLAPVEPRHARQFCFILLIVSCALASFALACATPFAAFAVISAAMLPLGSALLVTTGAWLVNQGIGFAALHYPIDINTISWGFAIGIAATLATLISAVVLRALPRGRTPLALALTVMCAYCAYEIALLAASLLLGGAGSFTPAIMARIGLLNVVWLIGLFAACEVARLINPLPRSKVR
jgi:hypothetical protein